MKTRKLQMWLKAAVIGVALAGAAGSGLAQTTNNPQVFDTTNSIISWRTWWGVDTAFSWDSSQDASNNPASGSLRMSAPFTGASGDQFMTFSTFSGNRDDLSLVLDGTTYTNVEFDIKIDPSSGQRKSYDDYGGLEVGFPTSWDGGAVVSLGTYTIPLTATNWTHVVRPINPTLANVDKIVGVSLKMWSDGQHTNALTFNVDNIHVVPIAVTNPPPPAPKISFEKTTQGLQLISTTAGGGNARYSIYAASGLSSWINSPTSTTYSVTIKDYPRPFATYPYFQTHMFLAPRSGMPYGPGDSSIDWNSTNLIFLHIQDNGDGSGYARFMWKTNTTGWGTPAQIWGNNTPATLSTPSILGTWSLEFTNNTSVTLRGPGNVSTNFTLPAEAIPYFDDPNGVYYYVGMQPNGDNKIGQSSVIGKIEVTGAVDASGQLSGDLSDSFSYPPLDSATWGVAASDPNGVQVVGPDSPLWLVWTLPDSGYVLEWAPDPTGETYGWLSDTSLLNVIQLGALKRALIPISSFSFTNSAYFHLTNSVLGSNSAVSGYVKFDLAQGSNQVTVPNLRMKDYRINYLVPNAPDGAFVTNASGVNTNLALTGWQDPNQLMFPGDQFDFYNPNVDIWTVVFAGDAVIGGAPQIWIGPADQTVGYGDAAALTVYAGGNATLAYQWQHAGTNLDGANATSLNLANIQAADGGEYTVVVNNSEGSVTSAVATLTVMNPAATLSGAAVRTNSFQFTVTGMANREYVVESAPDLVAGPWTAVVTNNGATFQFSEPAGTENRYYRARYVPVLTP